MVTCDRCGREFKTPQGLGGHLTLAHRIKPEDLLRVDLSPEQLQRLAGRNTQGVPGMANGEDALGPGIAAMGLAGLSLASSLPPWLVIVLLLALVGLGLWLLWLWSRELRQPQEQRVSLISR